MSEADSQMDNSSFSKFEPNDDMYKNMESFSMDIQDSEQGYHHDIPVESRESADFHSYRKNALSISLEEIDSKNSRVPIITLSKNEPDLVFTPSLITQKALYLNNSGMSRL